MFSVVPAVCLSVSMCLSMQQVLSHLFEISSFVREEMLPQFSVKPSLLQFQ